MKLTETSDFAHRELVHLSGSERQRVWIAMGLAQGKSIFVLLDVKRKPAWLANMVKQRSFPINTERPNVPILRKIMLMKPEKILLLQP